MHALTCSLVRIERRTSSATRQKESVKAQKLGRGAVAHGSGVVCPEAQTNSVMLADRGEWRARLGGGAAVRLVAPHHVRHIG